jgi:hypothetical protein
MMPQDVSRSPGLSDLGGFHIPQAKPPRESSCYYRRLIDLIFYLSWVSMHIYKSLCIHLYVYMHSQLLCIYALSTCHHQLDPISATVYLQHS